MRYDFKLYLRVLGEELDLVEYEFIDCGEGRRLERFGGVVCDRPAPVALWKKSAVPELWSGAGLRFSREERVWHGQIPPEWHVSFGENVFQLQPSGNGQIGIFPEQVINWRFIQQKVAAAVGQGREINVLNCFAHTGGSTLAALRAGARVCHVDAAGSANQRARCNVDISGLSDSPVRWITEDTLKFMRREFKRGRRYDGIILDPPAFGRMGKDVWKLERNLPELLSLAGFLLADRPLFFLLSCHPQGWSAEDLSGFVRRNFPVNEREDCGELAVCGTGNKLPLGYYYRLAF